MATVTLEQHRALANIKLGHPTRLAIALHLLDNEKASPKELTDVFGESLGATAYHVRTMLKHKLIRLSGERRVRGAVEHFYSLTADGRRKVEKAVGRES